ncbi:MAG TPA: hypothetical protein VGZ00_03635 [Candidatus Baltobacteraceae bacterium]|nr:hypothetical protein [Candidatus Baltobacteraceae bacterium]
MNHSYADIHSYFVEGFTMSTESRDPLYRIPDEFDSPSDRWNELNQKLQWNELKLLLKKWTAGLMRELDIIGKIDDEAGRTLAFRNLIVKVDESSEYGADHKITFSLIFKRANKTKSQSHYAPIVQEIAKMKSPNGLRRAIEASKETNEVFRYTLLEACVGSPSLSEARDYDRLKIYGTLRDVALSLADQNTAESAFTLLINRLLEDDGSITSQQHQAWVKAIRESACREPAKDNLVSNISSIASLAPSPPRTRSKPV